MSDNRAEITFGQHRVNDGFHAERRQAVAVDRGVVGEGRIRDLLDGVVLIDDGISATVSAVRVFLVNKTDGVVFLPRHGAVGTADVRALVVSVPVLRNGFRRAVVRERFQRLVVDTHIGASAAERHTLEEEEHLLVVFLAGDGNEHHFAVAGVVERRHAVVALAREGHFSPRTFSLLRVGEGEDIETASAVAATRQEHTAVGQFFSLRLVAVGHGAYVTSAEELPCFAKVVRIEHPVGRFVASLSAAAANEVEAAVFVDLRLRALADFSAADKPTTDGAVGALVELRIDKLFVDVLRFAPSGTIVVAIPACPSLMVVARAAEESRRARTRSDDHAGALAVANDAGVAIASLLVSNGSVAVARHHGRLQNVVPGLSVVVAAADVEVNASAADVGAAETVVGNSYDSAVVGRGDGRDAVWDVA